MRAALRLLVAFGTFSLALAAVLAPRVLGDEPPQLRLLAGEAGGTYHALARAIAEMPQDRLRFDVVSTDGSLGNLIMTSIGRADLCMAQADALIFLSDQPEYEAAMKHLVTVLPLHDEEIHVVVNQDSSVRRLADLKGKRVNIGIGASGSSVTSMVLLDILGIADETDTVQHGYDEAVADLVGGRLDAMIVTGGAPLKFLARLGPEKGTKLRLLDLDRKTVQKLTKDGPYWEAEIPAGAYRWQKQAVRTVSTLCLLLAHDRTPADRVYDAAKLILANAPRMVKKHRKWREVSKKSALELLRSGDLPFHPGAKRALEE
ncbi:TAXI family TRAP transporter solute-binding subunit [Planctomycetota bacterium]